MLWFSITLESEAPIRFTERERVFKGGIFHGMLEHAITEYSRGLYLELSGKADNRRAHYALFPPLDHSRRYRRGEQVKCGLVLFGAASAFWPEVISALLPQGALKLGIDRTPIGVLKIDALHPNRIPRAIFSRDIGYIEDSPEAIEVATHSGNGTESVMLRFLTPVTISSGAQRALSLHAVPLSLKRCIKALRERVSELEPSLADGFGFETDEWVSLEHGLRAVTIAKADIRPVEWWYGSSTKPKPVMLHGQIGEIEYLGHIPAPVARLLEVGQWTGIGQRTTLGQGWYRLAPYSSPADDGQIRV